MSWSTFWEMGLEDDGPNVKKERIVVYQHINAPTDSPTTRDHHRLEFRMGTSTVRYDWMAPKPSWSFLFLVEIVTVIISR